MDSLLPHSGFVSTCLNIPLLFVYLHHKGVEIQRNLVHIICTEGLKHLAECGGYGPLSQRTERLSNLASGGPALHRTLCHVTEIIALVILHFCLMIRQTTWFLYWIRNVFINSQYHVVCSNVIFSFLFSFDFPITG